MGKYAKLYERVLRGDADASINFKELCNLLALFGFEMRIKGSHHIFRKHEVVEKINLQKDGSKVKPYQVKQVRLLILKYNLKIAHDA